MQHDILTTPTPPERVPMVLDTDTANEIDDQFAVVHALLSQDRLQLEAIYATLFAREGNTPAEGVAESEAEIHRLLERLSVDPAGRVLRGADRFLAVDQPTVANAVSDDLIRRALEPRDGRLWVAAIGALTNIASALNEAPEIAERICVAWLGGQAQHAVDAREFNLYQDPIAARAVFDSGAPLVHIPCYGAASHLLTSTAELDAYVRPQGAIGEYLADIFRDHDPQFPGRSKEIWDLSATGFLIDDDWVPRRSIQRPTLSDDMRWILQPDDAALAPFTEAHYVQRDPIFHDLFTKLAEFHAGEREAGFAV
ncbi:MAG: nucleoside hydrolase [Chloroflexi bacterium]|nr:nucleoside hydrolase [Chloroflexota bacterium]MCY3697860.1 nucleoside hydrolase [Chloroflexota bacterium]